MSVLSPLAGPYSRDSLLSINILKFSLYCVPAKLGVRHILPLIVLRSHHDTASISFLFLFL